MGKREKQKKGGADLRKISTSAKDHISGAIRKLRKSERTHNQNISCSRAHVSPPVAGLPQSGGKLLLG